MLKVVIVDDEVLIRVGIKSCVEWEKYGFEVVGQASDGLQALEVISKVHPNIVLTDIKMPNMDGLDLLSELNKQYPHIKVIVLSCYNELDYVKRAMKMGAEDYILKLSMEPEALIEVLNKTKELIEKEKENKFENQNIENELRINKYLIKENLYQKFLDGSISCSEFEKSIKNLNLGLVADPSVIICCGIDDYKNAPMKSKMEDQHLLKFSFLNILEECLGELGEGDVAEVNNGEYIIRLIFDKLYSEKDLRNAVIEYHKKINSTLKKYLNISISFGIILPSKELAAMPEAYAQARQALDNKFYLGRESVVFFDDISEFLDKGILFDLENERRLAEYLRNLDGEGAKNLVDAIFSHLQEEKLYAPLKIKNLAAEILHSIQMFQKKWCSSYAAIDAIQENYTLEILMNLETMTDIRSWFIELIDHYVKELYDLQVSTVRPEILTIQNYIMEHIDEEITLDLAVKISHISKNYLSSIFKKETGEGFIDYVNRLKMEKAKELIAEYNLKSFEAAQKVGITDEAYFSRLFKRHIGTSPSKVKAWQKNK